MAKKTLQDDGAQQEDAQTEYLVPSLGVVVTAGSAAEAAEKAQALADKKAL